MYQELRDLTAAATGPGGPFEIQTVMVAGVPLRAYRHAPPTLRSLWLASQVHGDAAYLVFDDERITYAEAHALVASLAQSLQARYGVGPGDRVGLAMRNYPEWILGYWAIVALGAAVVGMNAWWTGPELAYAVADSQPKVIIADAERAERLLAQRIETGSVPLVAVRHAAPTVEGVVSWEDMVASPGVLPDAVIDPDSDACIFYTSGTTGWPKGALLTHRGCTNNVVNLFFWNSIAPAAIARAQDRPSPSASAGRAHRSSTTAEPHHPAAKPDPPFDGGQLVTLVTTPLFHVTACNCLLHPSTAVGGRIVLMYRWDPLRALELIAAEGVVSVSGVPTMSRELISHPRFAEFDTSTLRSVGGGGAQLQPDLVEKIDDRVETARPATGYGMTETCGVITAVSADFFRDKPETVGPILPSFEARLVGADGIDVGAGEIGELWVRGAPVVRGYLNRPEETAETITDGWLHTGDIARIDQDGFVAIVDRAKDMVLRGGENVYCAEVEVALFAHPAVRECAVFGVPDERLGEEVGAAVVVADDQTLGADELRGFLAERLAAYKIPRYLWLGTDPLPRNASGKFLKRDLRDSLDPATAR